MGDDVSDPKQGVSVANKFVADGVTFVVGHYNSGVTIPASEVYAENGILFVTPTATNPLVTERGLWNAFRACGRDDQQGIVAAKFILEKMKDKKVAIVDDKSTAGQGLADEMRKAYQAGGGKEILSEQINPGEKDYSALVAKIKQANADILFYGGQHTEAALIVRQMRDQGVHTILMGGDGISNSEFGAIGGDAAAGTLMTSFPGSDDIHDRQGCRRGVDQAWCAAGSDHTLRLRGDAGHRGRHHEGRQRRHAEGRRTISTRARKSRPCSGRSRTTPRATSSSRALSSSNGNRPTANLCP